MTAQDFQNWMAQMGFSRATEVADCLEMSRNYAQRWVRAAKKGEPIEVKRTTALAMSACAAGLKGWGEV